MVKPPSTLQQASQYFKDSPAPKVGTWVTDHEDLKTRDIAQMYGRSFAGTNEVRGEPIISWCTNHMTGSWFNIEEKQKLAGFMMDVTLREALSQETLVVCKTVHGRVASSAVIVEVDPTRSGKRRSMWRRTKDGWNFSLALMKVLCTRKLPKLFVDKEHREERKHFLRKIEHLGVCLHDWHPRLGPQHKHWYVRIVGVDPDFNGQGFGRELMEQVHVLADTVGMDCFLEAGSWNVGFYQRVGYTVMTEQQIDDLWNPKAEAGDVSLLVRRHAPQNVKRNTVGGLRLHSPKCVTGS
eukprot:Nitzschia sp. Nitz4//scaffold14_size191712//57771//58655//NITZ4_001711-RA/size191712-processed-gene-0.265-mRNA-1//1//CDS//3329536891//7522//frame0